MTESWADFDLFDELDLGHDGFFPPPDQPPGDHCAVPDTHLRFQDEVTKGVDNGKIQGMIEEIKQIQGRIDSDAGPPQVATKRPCSECSGGSTLSKVVVE